LVDEFQLLFLVSTVMHTYRGTVCSTFRDDTTTTRIIYDMKEK